MHHIYCISGLGADHRIFQKLKIDNAELHYIEWELPAIDDTMRSYALKLAKQIKHSVIILVGVSFGGMLATEISRYYQQVKAGNSENQKPELNAALTINKTILISSCKATMELPTLMKLASRMKVHKAVPYKLVLRNSALNRFAFDLRSSEEELYLKRLMLEENNIPLIKRSIGIILNWKAGLPENVIHIHGTGDRLLTPRNVKADYWIRDGGHFMVWNRADEISAILNSLIEN
jgi:pimeloyl-ACP methyl ester carboxylesterase